MLAHSISNGSPLLESRHLFYNATQNEFNGRQKIETSDINRPNRSYGANNCSNNNILRSTNHISRGGFSGYPRETVGMETYPRSSESETRETTEAMDEAVDGDEPGTLPLSDDMMQAYSRPHNVAATPRYPRYEDEEIRKNTFASWINPFPSAQQLIASGFFFLGGRDSVQCFQCGIILHSWEREDTPDGEHISHSPNCAFLYKKQQADREAQTARRNFPSSASEMSGHSVQWQNDASRQGLPYQNTYPATRPMSPAQNPSNVMHKVARLGHPEAVIMRAMEKLRISGDGNITTTKLLDAVYSLEDEEFTKAQAEAGVVVSDDDGETHAAEEEEIAPHGGADGGARFDAGEAQGQSIEPPTPPATKERLQLLEKENEDLRQRTLCRVCDDRPATELFLPCGHLACCDQCTNKLELCPFCRTKIQRTYHVFMP